MSDFAPRDADPVARKAADYFARRSFGPWDEADQGELDAWLSEALLHRVAYLRLEGAVAHARRLTALRVRRSDDSGPADARRKRRAMILGSGALLAASLAAALQFGIPLLDAILQPPIRTYSTDVGGRTLIKFADHTQIELNTNTVLRLRMTNRKREVWLDRGEAWFQVAHNAANPFTLYVGRDRVDDVGTEFLVRHESAATEVTLLEGRAALASPGAPVAMLSAGDDGTATLRGLSVTRKSPQQLKDELSWRRGTLVFHATPLVDVVQEFNRYNTTRLVVADPNIGGLKISAELKSDDYEGFLQLARAALHLRIDQKGNVILIFGPSQPKRRVKTARPTQ